MCVCVCVQVRFLCLIYIYIYIHTYIHTHTNQDVCMYMCVFMHKYRLEQGDQQLHLYIHTYFQDGTSAIHRASENGDLELVKLLVEIGGNDLLKTEGFSNLTYVRHAVNVCMCVSFVCIHDEREGGREGEREREREGGRAGGGERARACEAPC